MRLFKVQDVLGLSCIVEDYFMELLPHIAFVIPKIKTYKQIQKVLVELQLTVMRKLMSHTHTLLVTFLNTE